MFDVTFSSPIQGIERAAAKVETHAQAIAEGRISIRNMTGLMEGKRALQANVVTVKTADQMFGSLLDILA